MLVLRSFHLDGDTALQPVLPSGFDCTPPGALLLLTSGRADSRLVLQDVLLHYGPSEINRVQIIFLFLRYIPAETFHQRLVVTPAVHGLGPDDLSQISLLSTKTLNVAAQNTVKKQLGIGKRSLDEFLDEHPEAMAELVHGPVTPHVGAIVWSSRRHSHPSGNPIQIAAIFDGSVVSHAAFRQAKEKESEILGVQVQGSGLTLVPWQREMGEARPTRTKSRTSSPKSKTKGASTSA